MPEINRPVLICDLDGTILRNNSFPLWISYLIAGPLPDFGFRARARLSLRAQKLVLQRRFGRIDHQQLMRGVQQAWYDAGGERASKSAERIQRRLRHLVRPAFEPLLRQIADGEHDAVLATAAAGEYAIGLGQQLGFRHILATPNRLELDQPLNVGPQKLWRVLEFLVGQRWVDRPLVLLTDHIDDLPLVLHSHAVGWFGSAAAMEHAGGQADGVKLISCNELDAVALSHALSELVAHAAAPRSRSRGC